MSDEFKTDLHVLRLIVRDLALIIFDNLDPTKAASDAYNTLAEHIRTLDEMIGDDDLEEPHQP